jgi:site-specific DNA-methyltransferase (adenine-specific)
MYRILEGDVMEQLKALAEASVDAVVTDPPYGLNFMGKEWDRLGDHSANFTNLDKPHASQSAYPMNKSRGRPICETDGPMQQRWHLRWAQEALRVLKPGGHLLAFGGSRTYHRLACAIEDAGFEIRDQIMWIYGSGFPKSLDVSKTIDKAAGTENVVGTKPDRWTGKGNSLNFATDRPQTICKITEPVTDAAKQWQGWGTALKPAHEPIVVARKPLVGTVAANVLQYGTGALNIDACRIEHVTVGDGNLALNPQLRRHINGGNGGNIIAHEEERRVVTPNQLGRWPANVIHDGSEEVLAAFPDAPGQQGAVSGEEPSTKTHGVYGGFKTRLPATPRDGEPSASRRYVTQGATNFAALPGERRLDLGSAARFFYCAKADKEEREIGCYGLNAQPLAYGNQALAEVKRGVTEKHAKSGMNAVKMRGNVHPTVKPIDLMAYLCRLVTPPGGTVLDCFMGSGSTGMAALRGGFNFIGIEKNPEYVEIARLRLAGDAPLFNREAGDAQDANADDLQPSLFTDHCELTTDNCLEDA